MRLAFADDSGCAGTLPGPGSPIQPHFILGAVLVDGLRSQELLVDFLDLKKRFHPGLHAKCITSEDAARVEVKGSDIRKRLRDDNPRSRRKSAFRLLDAFVALLERHRVDLAGIVTFKGYGPRNSVPTHLAVESLARLAVAVSDMGIVGDDHVQLYVDNRAQNTEVAQTRLHWGNDSEAGTHAGLVGRPVFASSRRHLGLQLADWYTSVLLTPISLWRLQDRDTPGPHVRPEYEELADRYASRLRALVPESVDGDSAVIHDRLREREYSLRAFLEVGTEGCRRSAYPFLSEARKGGSSPCTAR